MVKERLTPGTSNQDRLTQPLGGLFLVGHWVLAGLDVGRFHWSPVPWGAQLVGVLPILGFAALFIRRTLIEDRMLQSDLQGYKSYSDRVRFRLVPGIF